MDYLNSVRDFNQFQPLWNDFNFRQIWRKKYGHLDKTDEVVNFFLDYWIKRLNTDWHELGKKSYLSVKDINYGTIKSTNRNGQNGIG